MIFLLTITFDFGPEGILLLIGMMFLGVIEICGWRDRGPVGNDDGIGLTGTISSEIEGAGSGAGVTKLGGGGEGETGRRYD